MVRTLADLDEYKKVIRAYDEARANVARLGPESREKAQEAERLKKQASEARVLAAAGDYTQEEVDQMRREADRAALDAEQLAEELEIQQKAVQLLKDRIAKAKITGGRALRAEYAEEHARRVRELVEAAERVQELNAELQELEELAKRNNVGIPSVAWDGIFTTAGSGPAARAKPLSEWRAELQHKHNLTLNGDDQ